MYVCFCCVTNKLSEFLSPKFDICTKSDNEGSCLLGVRPVSVSVVHRAKLTPPPPPRPTALMLIFTHYCFKFVTAPTLIRPSLGWTRHDVFCVTVRLSTAQQTQDIDPMLKQCWPTVYDAGSTLVQHWVDVSVLCRLL